MKQRLLVAAVGVPLLLVILLVCPAWATLILTGVIIGVAAYELLHTAGKAVPAGVYGMTIAVSVITAVYIFTGSDAFSVGSISSVTMIRWYFVMFLFFVAVITFAREQKLCFTDLAVAVVAGIVFPVMYSCIALLRKEEAFGKVYVMAPFVIAFIGDSFSMLFGSKFGKKKLAPKVSPNKTWAGFIAGPFGSAIGMVLLGLIGKLVWSYAPNYLLLVVCGVVSNLFGQLGDLSTSLIKREVGIKDYSRLFLTHGGMLDRFDSTMFIAPIVYFFVQGGVI